MSEPGFGGAAVRKLRMMESFLYSGVAQDGEGERTGRARAAVQTRFGEEFGGMDTVIRSRRSKR